MMTWLSNKQMVLSFTKIEGNSNDPNIIPKVKIVVPPEFINELETQGKIIRVDDSGFDPKAHNYGIMIFIKDAQNVSNDPTGVQKPTPSKDITAQCQLVLI